jgi:hypothetical protein
MFLIPCSVVSVACLTLQPWISVCSNRFLTVIHDDEGQ